MRKVIQIFPGGSGIVDLDNKVHKIKISGDTVDQVPNTAENREIYFGISKTAKAKKGTIKLVEK